MASLEAAVIAVCLLLLCALWATVVAQARFEREETLALAVIRNDNVVVAFEQYTVRTIDGVDNMLKAIRREYARSGTLIDLRGLMQDLEIDSDSVLGVGIIDERGTLVATTMSSVTAPGNFSDREYFKFHVPRDTGRAFVGAPIVSRVLGTAVVPISRRITKADGTFGGTVGAQIDPRRFTQVYQDAQLLDRDMMSLVGRDGITRARRNGNRESSGEDVTKTPGFLREIEKAAGHFSAPGGLDSVARLYSFRALRDYPLIVTAGRAEIDVLAEVSERQTRQYAIAAAATTLIVLAALALLMALDRRRRTFRMLSVGQKRLRTTFRKAPIGIIHTDLDGHFIEANQKFCELIGYSETELKDLTFADITHPKDVSTSLDYARELLSDEVVKSNNEVEKRYIRKDGGVAWFTVSAAVMRDGTGKPEYLVASVHDITERKQREDRLRLSSNMLSAVGQAVIATDLEGAINYVNPFAEKMFGFTSMEMTGRLFFDIAPTDSREQMATIARGVLRGESWSGEYQVRRRDGTSFPVHLGFSPIHDSSGALMGTIGIVKDITERKNYERQIEYLATHDALTGLPNRNLLDDRMSQAVAHAERTGTHLAIMFLDLDHFKFVNDGFGHSVGDALLKAIAERLYSSIRRADTVARLGGDEFVILLTDLQEPLSAASKVARTVLECFARPFATEVGEFTVTSSIGISLYPADGQNLTELLKSADAAMYRSKGKGRNDYEFYSGEMSAKAAARVELEVALRQALTRGQFELHYQPQLATTTGEVVATEALIRWRHPRLGQVSPVDFIPLAEETGLIVPIGEWVLRTACRQNKAWQDSGMPALPVGVNLAALQLRQPGFYDMVARVLEETGLAPRYLNLELTESMMVDKNDAVIACLNQLRALGTTLSMDDFGTGYSNLSYLIHLPLDMLKIDRSFVRDLPNHPGAASIASAIVSMGHGLGMRVVAEGVETIEQAEFLQNISCELAQGFLYCKPLAADACAAWIRSRDIAPTDREKLQRSMAGRRALQKRPVAEQEFIKASETLEREVEILAGRLSVMRAKLQAAKEWEQGPGHTSESICELPPLV